MLLKPGMPSLICNRANGLGPYLEMWELVLVLLVLVADFPDCMLCLSLGVPWWLSGLGLQDE